MVTQFPVFLEIWDYLWDIQMDFFWRSIVFDCAFDFLHSFLMGIFLLMQTIYYIHTHFWHGNTSMICLSMQVSTSFPSQKSHETDQCRYRSVARWWAAAQCLNIQQGNTRNQKSRNNRQGYCVFVYILLILCEFECPPAFSKDSSKRFKIRPVTKCWFQFTSNRTEHPIFATWRNIYSSGFPGDLINYDRMTGRSLDFDSSILKRFRLCGQRSSKIFVWNSCTPRCKGLQW